MPWVDDTGGPHEPGDYALAAAFFAFLLFALCGIVTSCVAKAKGTSGHPTSSQSLPETESEERPGD